MEDIARLKHEEEATSAEIERLEKELAIAPTVITGSTGQSIPNPLFRELREHRKDLARISLALSHPESFARVNAAMRGGRNR